MAPMPRHEQAQQQLTNNNDDKSASAVPNGCLSVTVLSVYDLQNDEAPSCVSFSCLGQRKTTGPPLARHKDRNSYKFSQAVSSPSRLDIRASLAQLYKSTATLTVEYGGDNNKQPPLEANLPIDSLKIQETTWLILNLKHKDASSYEGENEVTPPTVRIEVRLEGPFRPQFATLLTLAQSWCRLIDSVQSQFSSVTRFIPDSSNTMAWALLVLGLVLSSPLWILFLPLIVVVAPLYFLSTRMGRSRLLDLVGAPLSNTILSTPSGQRLLYDTGPPEPTPVAVARLILPRDAYGKLLLSILIDVVGCTSYLLPVVGEVIVDVPWAPLQTIVIMAMYEPQQQQDETKNNDPLLENLKYLSFAEEILPFTDIVPSATLGWFIEYVIVPNKRKKESDNLTELIQKME